MSTIARHTPGPWSIDQNTVDLITADCDGEPVCEISQRSEDPDCLSEEERANAKLIASAPDLLAAVKGLLLHAPQPSGNIKKEYHYLLYREAAKTAITKAEWRSA